MLINGSRLKFDTDRINIFSINPDASGSMLCNTEKMKEGLELYKRSFKNFSEANSMSVSLNMFNGEYHFRPFKGIESFSTYYSTGGGTALYGSIKDGAQNLLDYIAKVTEENNCIPRATFIILSDGHPEGDYGTIGEAKDAISKLNEAGVTTVFVAFGRAIEARFGEELGFQATRDINNMDDITSFMGEELSRSCKEQSRSRKSLGSNFFSRAAKSSKASSKDAKTAQILEDEDWFV